MDFSRALTPPRSVRLHTPEAPKHGFSDDWTPYSPRKSARLSDRATNHNTHRRTPSPQPDTRIHSTPLGSPRQSKKYHLATPRFDMDSFSSPQKKRQPKMDTLQRASGSSITKMTEAQSTTRNTMMASAAGLLPTPAKTPQKAPSPKSKAKVQAIARNLFHQVEEPEIMPSPSRSRDKKLFGGFGLDEQDDSIPIFTDSQDRIPEIDPSEDNPFYVAHSHWNGERAAPPPLRRSKRQTVKVPGEGKVTIEEAVQREDGMLIVFRGKKQFRKFAEMGDDFNDERGLDEADGGLDSAVESRRMTRSSVKPRLLFPTVEKQPSHSDEEAETDIEEDNISTHGDAMEVKKPNTPLEMVDDKTPDTPVAPKFAPVSPPTTMRTTRFGTRSAHEISPMKSTRRAGKPRSPFDGWRRGKAGSDDDHGLSLKRSGDSLSADDAKRTRI